MTARHTAKPLRIGLVLHSTRSDNLGVGALTVAEVAILRELAQGLGRRLELLVFDWKGPRAPYVSGDDITIADFGLKALLNPFDYLAKVSTCDLLVDIGAGDSFADIYGKRRMRQNLAIKALARLGGTPVVMAPQTIGPFASASGRAMARICLSLCRFVTTRDGLSSRALDDLGFQGVRIEASDVALRLPYDPPLPRGDGPPRAGINVSGLLFSHGYTGHNEFGIAFDYAALIRNLVTDLQARGAQVHLVPHVIVEQGRLAMEDDMAACKAIADEMRGCIVAPAFASPSEAKSYIASLDFFTGARMHACIAAMSSGVAVVPMAYSRKFAGLFGSIGYDRTVDCTALDAETVRAAVLAGFDARETLADEARAALDKGLAKLALYQQALGSVIA